MDSCHLHVVLGFLDHSMAFCFAFRTVDLILDVRGMRSIWAPHNVDLPIPVDSFAAASKYFKGVKSASKLCIVNLHFLTIYSSSGHVRVRIIGANAGQKISNDASIYDAELQRK